MGEITTYKGWYCDSVGRYTLTDNVMPILYSSGAMKKPQGNPAADFYLGVRPGPCWRAWPYG